MKKTILFIALISTVGLHAQTAVDFNTAFADGWSSWIGQTLTFTNDFVVLNPQNKWVAPHRLRAAEEYGEEGTIAYTEAEAANANAKCTLNGVYFTYATHQAGTIIRNLTATVTAANTLQAVSTPTMIPTKMPTVRPDLGATNVVVCAANIQNFFVTLGGYAGAENETQLAVQTTKISTALYHMDADIYALCEVEQGPLAATALVNAMNTLAGTDRYAWVDAGFTTYDGIMICYLYRKDVVEPYGSYVKPYNYAPMKFREAIQCFKHKATNEKFNLSLNHFYAKVSKADADRQENMQYLVNKLSSVTSTDPDILVVGDLNAYTMEESNLMLSRDQHYVDLLMKYAPEGYSYVYSDDGTVGYLDHAYANATMAEQVTKAVPYHLNADMYYKRGFKYDDNSMYRYADHDPILVGLRLGDHTAAAESVEVTEPCKKILHNGLLIIERGGVQYTITGQRLY